MKAINKTALSAIFATLLSAPLGCAAQTPQPSFQPPLLTAQPSTSTARPAPAPWPQLPGWPVPHAGWPAPQGWPTPQTWPLPWPGLQPPTPQASKKVPSPAPGAPAAVAYATSRLGTPYCWGGNGPGCYDCSGLTTASWKTGGKAIPRTSDAQADLPEVPFDKIVPGDILWRPGHVALYVGNGRVIHAPRTGDVVRYATTARFVKAVRP